MMLRRLELAVVAVLACGAAFAQPGLTVKDGRFYREGRAYRGVGCNYFDLFRRVLLEPTNTTSLAGLHRLSVAGVPFVRFAGPYSEREWRLYLEQKEEYFRRLDLVVRAAEAERIGLVPSLFWSYSLSQAVGEHRGQWGNPSSRTMALARQYTADVVSRYRTSPAIWAWEFGNEKNLSADLPNAANFRPKNGSAEDDVTSAQVTVMLSEFARAVRVLDTWRPILSGNSHPRPSAWHNAASRSWAPDSQAQSREVLLRDNPAPLDTLGVHLYDDGDVAKTLGAWVTNRSGYLRWLRGVSDEVGRPLVVGEFGVEVKVGGDASRARFAALLDEMERARVDLAAFWVYDLPTQEGSWNATFGNARAFMLEQVAEANRRWEAAAQGEGAKSQPCK